jgi:hypothetical protein
MKKAALSLAAMEGRLVIPANSVRLSSLPKIVCDFHKFPAKNPGLLDLDHFLTMNTAFVGVEGEDCLCVGPGFPF